MKKIKRKKITYIFFISALIFIFTGCGFANTFKKEQANENTDLKNLKLAREAAVMLMLNEPDAASEYPGHTYYYDAENDCLLDSADNDVLYVEKLTKTLNGYGKGTTDNAACEEYGMTTDKTVSTNIITVPEKTNSLIPSGLDYDGIYDANDNVKDLVIAVTLVKNNNASNLYMAWVPSPQN